MAGKVPAGSNRDGFEREALAERLAEVENRCREVYGGQVRACLEQVIAQRDRTVAAFGESEFRNRRILESVVSDRFEGAHFLPCLARLEKFDIGKIGAVSERAGADRFDACRDLDRGQPGARKSTCADGLEHRAFLKRDTREERARTEGRPTDRRKPAALFDGDRRKYITIAEGIVPDRDDRRRNGDTRQRIGVIERVISDRNRSVRQHDGGDAASVEGIRADRKIRSSRTAEVDGRELISLIECTITDGREGGRQHNGFEVALPRITAVAYIIVRPEGIRTDLHRPLGELDVYQRRASGKDAVIIGI